MTDVHTKQQRSHNMSRIRSRGNRSTELKFIRLLRAEHLTGWRRGSKLFGKPDFVFPTQKVAVFVDGCFWHRCPYCAFVPGSNVKYWRAKLHRNSARDRQVVSVLRKRGWRVVRVWEHDLAKPRSVRSKVLRGLTAA